MKKLIAAIGALLAVAVITTVAQEFIGRQPTADERQRVSGLGYYPQLVNPSHTIYSPGSEEQYDLILGGSNTTVIFTSANTSNVQVRLPNCTNSVGAIFTVIAGVNAYPKLTNVNGNTFTTYTNHQAASHAVSHQMNSNQMIRVFSPNGTNWFVLKVAL